MTPHRYSDTRERIVLVMGRAGRALAVKELAAVLDRTPPTILHALYALRDDDVVKPTVPAGAVRGNWWTLTGEPLRISPTSIGKAARQNFDHRALARALAAWPATRRALRSPQGLAL